ncbi:protein ROOT PRIMORDIUM DEFECTIVE 1 [Humulus lupulus]|uniref:protein ROOT PRIMORDIUM DEFECTIVE 1 n=1 Tax=Humulus lupulus TaxID=3486 RepID=UPI002B40C81B|nr:protein ROOT PRIMORDIUM DEFECTIVE 1 [Humulus lupulus]XP_062093640.1 protein ROOT PRIMORDIUM DEFECTIVE 1 [Humulus lupulus]
MNMTRMKLGMISMGMGSRIVGFMRNHSYQLFPPSITVRLKTTSSHYVSSRARDPTFEKFMDNYKNLLKVVSIQDLILANPQNPVVSLEFLCKLSQKLHLNRGSASFLRKYPHIFRIFYDPTKSQPLCALTNAALRIAHQESQAIAVSLPLVVNRLLRLLSMSTSKTVPLRAIFKVWRELGLPDDFEDSVLSQNPHLFKLLDGSEPGTHTLRMVDDVRNQTYSFTSAVENWRVEECCKENCGVERTEIQFSFRHGYPPGMRLSKNFKAKVKLWQSLPYVGPYEAMLPGTMRSKAAAMALEKRAVAIVHEFLSLTVEKMVEVEKISHFRKWFGIDLNIRDLFLDHPGIFYLSTKGKRHTVFLREAYDRGCLIHPNPVYHARRKLLDLVLLGRRGLVLEESSLRDVEETELLGES